MLPGSIVATRVFVATARLSIVATEVRTFDIVATDIWIRTAPTPTVHKHVDVKAHLVRDMQLRDIVQLQHVSTDMQPADAMAKVLPRPATEKYRGWILRGCLPAPPVPAPSSASAP